MIPSNYTIRVYGLLIKNRAVLLSRENIYGQIYNKFPGGGLEFGEGVIDCVKREFMEELNINLSKTEHFYTTEDYYASAFDNEVQVLSLYYIVDSLELDKIKTGDPENNLLLSKPEDQVVYWCPIDKLSKEPFSFPIDKIVADKLLEEYGS